MGSGARLSPKDKREPNVYCLAPEGAWIMLITQNRMTDDLTSGSAALHLQSNSEALLATLSERPYTPLPCPLVAGQWPSVNLAR